jgi:hypothetical protein
VPISADGMLPASGRIVPSNWNGGKQKAGDAQVNGAPPIQRDAIPRLFKMREERSRLVFRLAERGGLMQHGLEYR